ncbi:unnamed protein product [Brassicogethes aeneus]|uniref:Spermidine synthase n=2 Tax=Brassicogethes aeneus TaxID=1431903 RepID=A0A9P0AXH9_BRAAE|nr:unnamed protein product [Brassicogethes aeneus]
MDAIRNGWFSELSSLWPAQCFSLEVTEPLYSGKSDFQDVLVFKSKKHGNVLVLDGAIQCTEFDEFSYQEMITFLPLNAHGNPQKVLIVGGGDGGVAREVSKHPLVKEIVQVEIDQKVIDVSKKYLPGMAAGFDSPKLTLLVCDGFEYMKNHQNEFDVIITDSSDPVGPAENLFTESYFALLKKALKPNGVICSQGGTVWCCLDYIKKTLDGCRKHFKNVEYARCSVPTYPNGEIGFVIATDDQSLQLSKAKYVFTEKELDELRLKYYTPEVHTAAFALPNFVRQALKSSS